MDVADYLTKARRSLDGATSEYFAKRFDNCANRCYYACYQAAVAALIAEGFRSTSTPPWSHSSVQARFSGEIVGRRKRIDAVHRDTLSRLLELRMYADYRPGSLSDAQAGRALKRATAFVDAVEARWRD